MKGFKEALVRILIIGISMVCTFFSKADLCLGLLIVCLCILRVSLWLVYQTFPSFWDTMAELDVKVRILPNIKAFGKEDGKTILSYVLTSAFAAGVIILNPLARFVMWVSERNDVQVLRIDVLVILYIFYAARMIARQEFV